MLYFAKPKPHSVLNLTYLTQITYKDMHADMGYKTALTLMYLSGSMMKMGCLCYTYFTFDSTIFEQVEGAAMGSPLSPTVVNLYMEAFEERALESAVLCPRVWLRYVDDTFVLWPHGEDELDAFNNCLNTQHPSIHNGKGELRTNPFS